jgi:putative colanic acid biosynthesis acetyltransferase WcaF
MELRSYTTGDFSPGRPLIVGVLWYFLGRHLLTTSLLPFSCIKRGLLRLFGATVGQHVVVKPGVKVKFPWRLHIGEHSWIGEDVWIDNLAEVTIGSNTCISQGVYLCTGNHNWRQTSFDLQPAPITLGNKVWVAAQVKVGPGVQINDGSVVTLGSVVTGSLPAYGIYRGNPAVLVGPRVIQDTVPHHKVLLCNDSYPPDVAATGQYLRDLTKALQRAGWKTEVISSSRKHSEHGYASEEYEGIVVKRFGPPWRDGYGKARRIASCLYAIAAMIRHVIRCTDVHSLVLLSSPPLAYIPISWIARIRGIPYALWIMDINPHQAIKAGWIREGGLLDRLLRHAVRGALAHAHRIVTLDSDMASTVKDLLNTSDSLTVVPLWAPEVLLHTSPLSDKEPHPNPPLPTSSPQSLSAVKKPITIMYSGTLSLCHPLQTLLDAANLLRNDVRFAFVIVGSGPQRNALEQYAHHLSLSNVTFRNAVPYGELPALLSSADMHIVSFGDEYRGLVHPSKIYGVLASKKPFVLLGNANSFIDREWVSRRWGARVSHGDADALCKHLCSFASSAELQPEAQNYSSEYEAILSHIRYENVVPLLIKALDLGQQQ